MGKTTEISWTDHTFNPWWGCTKVSPACDHCYAESFSKRTGNAVWGKDAPRRFFSDAHWAEPLKWNRDAEIAGVRRRVFCGSMCDVMEDREDLTGHRDRLYHLIAVTPHLDWLLLTKRPQNFSRFLPFIWLHSPMPNVWGMTTVESPEYLWRAEALLKTPFRKRGLSMEPLLALVDISRQLSTLGIDWVIVGGESGHGARPMHPNWARSLRDQCVEVGVAFHFKQFGEHNSDLIRVGKKKAGRLLDGVEWNQFPILSRGIGVSDGK
jgi:protein gp37